ENKARDVRLSANLIDCRHELRGWRSSDILPAIAVVVAATIGGFNSRGAQTKAVEPPSNRARCARVRPILLPGHRSSLRHARSKVADPLLSSHRWVWSRHPLLAQAKFGAHFPCRVRPRVHGTILFRSSRLARTLPITGASSEQIRLG